MSTYDELKDDPNATAVFWCEMSGIPWSPSDGVVTAAHFGDAYTPTLTFVPSLQVIKDSFGRSLEAHRGLATVGGFSVSVTDTTPAAYPSGFYTWLFGAERSTIASANLGEDIDPTETAWTLETGGNMPLSGDGVDPGLAYCELETVYYLNHFSTGFGNPDTWDTVTRAAFHSPATWHKDNPYGIYPKVTDHPTEWAGRIVSLYQSYMAGDGSLASTGGTTATARAAAKCWRGVLRDINYRDNTWTIRCDSLDTLLKRQVVRGQPEALISARVEVQKLFDGGTDRGGCVAAVNMTYPAGVVGPFAYFIAIPTGVYSRETFLAAVNAQCQAGVTLDEDGNDTWIGTLNFAFNPDKLTVTYTTDAVGANVRTCVVNLGVHGIGAGGIDGGNGNINTASYWETLGKIPDEGGDVWNSANDDPNPAVDTAIAHDWPSVVETTLDMSHPRSVALAPAEGFGGPEGIAGFSLHDYVAIISQSGVSAAQILEINIAVGTITLHRVRVLDLEGMVHVGATDNPIRIRRAFYGYPAQNGQNNAGPALAEPALRLLLGTGSPAFNHANYDMDPEGIGISFPHLSPMAGADDTASCVNIQGFLDFFGEAGAYVEWAIDFLYEPTEYLGWLRNRVGFLGGFITIQNGQLTVTRGVGPLVSDAQHTITEDELLPGWQAQLGQIATIDGVTFKHDWSLAQQKYMQTTTAIAGDKVSGKEPQNAITWEDKGLRTDSARLQALAYNFLYDFSASNRIYSGSTDRVHWDIEPGQVVRFSDEGAGGTTDDTRRYQGLPNTAGTRGFGTGTNVARMVVLSATASPADGTTDLRLMKINTRRSGYSPSAWIVSWADAAGKTTLTCQSQFFSPTADGVDVSRFTVGDKVRVVSINPTQAGAEPGVETSEGGLTIDSINATASTITLTGVLAVAWPSPPAAASQCMVLQHDPYTTASQTSRAKEWCHVGDSSGDIGDGGDDAYQW